MSGRRETEHDAELAALADGSLAPERRAAVEAHLAGSPELAERLAEQERALSLVRSAAAQTEAPAGLRARVEAQRRAPSRRGPLLVAGAAVAAAAAIVAVALLSTAESQQRFHADLAATGAVPDAAGQATLTKTSSGWRIELDATGLPRLDGGRFYEAWLRNADGVLVPIGTFNEGRKVTLWAGVSPVDFPTLTVTRESADGDQDSSGDRVLVGPVDVSG